MILFFSTTQQYISLKFSIEIFNLNIKYQKFANLITGILNYFVIPQRFFFKCSILTTFILTPCKCEIHLVKKIFYG